MSLILLAGAATTSFGLMGLSALTIADNAQIELAILRPVDIAGCRRLRNCFYQNVTTPYTRSFVIDSRSILAKPDAGLGRIDQYFGAFFLNPNQALVIIGKTPPCRYWSFIPYLWRSGTPTKDNQFGDISFSSLNNGVNNFSVPSATRIAVVMTRNKQVYEREKMRVANVDPTVTVVPLYVTEQAPMNAPVTYLLRTAFFIGEGTLQNYIVDPELFSYRVTYNKIGYYGVKTLYPQGMDSIPEMVLGTKYIVQPANPLEPSELPYQQEFNEYVKTIISRYNIIREIRLEPFLQAELGEPYSNGQQCRDTDINCQGDNPDTIYITSEQIEIIGNQGILIISPNHSTFGRAYYTSFNLYDETIKTGIDSVIPEPGTRYYFHVFHPREISNVGLYRLISRAYVQLPQNIAGSSQTIILGKAYVVGE